MQIIFYGDVCTGIGAAKVAWDALGWKAQWMAQYDPEHDYATGQDFPSRVLAHHYPGIPNLGDMLLLREKKEYNERLINVLVGGTPCQAFSIAGLRRGLDDERTNLALTFSRILVDKRPAWFVWENVPGVLNSESSGGSETDTEEDDGTGSTASDFACLLSAWTGHDIGSQEFTKAGIIEAATEEHYSIAWRILDSRYFGVPQRRRRIFVIGHIGKDWRPPVAVLFERESLYRDFTPGRAPGKDTATGTESGSDSGGAYRLVNFGLYVDDGTASALKKRDYKDATDLVIMDYPPHAFKERGGKPGGGKGYMGSDECAYALTKCNDAQRVLYKNLVRRLTPLERERLQGFPDGYTDIPGAKNADREAALGNSMTVHVMKWIGERIDKVHRLLLKIR